MPLPFEEESRSQPAQSRNEGEAHVACSIAPTIPHKEPAILFFTGLLHLLTATPKTQNPLAAHTLFPLLLDWPSSEHFLNRQLQLLAVIIGKLSMLINTDSCRSLLFCQTSSQVTVLPSTPAFCSLNMERMRWDSSPKILTCHSLSSPVVFFMALPLSSTCCHAEISPRSLFLILPLCLALGISASPIPHSHCWDLPPSPQPILWAPTFLCF